MSQFAALRPRRPHAAGLYAYHTGRIFTPGAGNEVFEPSFPLPLFAVQGNGVLCGQAPRPYALSPQVYAPPRTTTAGLGGLIHGQIIHQSLTDDSENG